MDVNPVVRTTDQSTNGTNSSSSGLPQWAVLLIIILVTLVFCICLCFCIQRSCKNKCKKKDGKGVKQKGAKPGLSKSKVQLDIPPLVENMELNEDANSTDEPQNLGKLEYSIDYDFQKQELTVGVIQAQELPPMDSMSGLCDPYVKVYILPDKKEVFRTEVIKRSLNPIFDQTFVFKNLVYGQLSGKTLVFSVFDHDRFSRNDAIGEVQIPLNAVDLGRVIKEIKELIPPPRDRESENQLGEICVTLRWVPTNGKLTVTILEAKNLKKMDVGGLSDPYVKLSIIQNEKRLKKKKTSIKKNTLNPYFNESFTFDIAQEDIQRVQLLLIIVDYDRLGSSEPIGKVLLGNHTSGIEFRHWRDMIMSPRRPIAQWHALKPVQEGKTA